MKEYPRIGKSKKSTDEESRFRDLFHQYYQPLVSYADRYLYSLDMAENIVQDLFLKIWESRAEVLGYHNISAYLYQMVHFRCLNHLRDTDKRSAVLETIQSKLDLTQTNEYIRQETYRLIMKAVQELPESCRQIFLYTLHGYSAQEIAEKMAISVETVKKQKQIARAKLKEKVYRFLMLLITVSVLAARVFRSIHL